MTLYNDTLREMVKAAAARYEALSPEKKAEHDKAQRESWVRGMMARCEHGELDFEQCQKCREKYRAREPETMRTAGTQYWQDRAITAETKVSDLLARLEQAEARVGELETALRLFVRPEDATMEGILWGDMPDDAPGSITIKLRDIRTARAALKEPRP